MTRRKQRKGLKVFERGEDRVTVGCITETAEIKYSAAYSRAVMWRDDPKLDFDWLFKPHAEVIAKWSRFAEGAACRPNKVFLKNEDKVTSSCVSEAVGCVISTAFSRCEKWERDPYLDLDWLFRPLDKKYNTKKMLPKGVAEIKFEKLKEEEERIREVCSKKRASKDEEYRNALRKHYGLPPS